MTTEEFSNEFDVLVDSYRRFKAYDNKLELDSIEYTEYEKSVYLTKAQEDIVKELYSSNYTSFEANEETRRQLDSLVKLYEPSDKSDYSYKISDKFTHTCYNIPDDCWYIVYELASFESEDKCLNDHIADIIPVTHDDYYRTINNPFRGPNNRRILRLDSGEKVVELVSKYAISQYLMRYISLPEPIILCDLTLDDISIGGTEYKTINDCKLNESLHKEILDRAVRMALSSRINNTNNNTSK